MKNLVWILILLVVACQETEEGGPNLQPEEEGNESDSQEEFTELTTSLESPWDIENSGDTIFISEREGTIARIEEGEDLEREPVETEKNITQIGEGGLLGLKLHPGFATNQHAFGYHTYEEEGEVYNRLIKLEYKDGQWLEIEALLEKIPGNNYHNGGRVEIGPDKLIYITTGDAQNESLAQNKESLAGKILRLDFNGDIPEDNPNQNSYVYSYGHRNPQGLGWSEQGELFASEHGPSNHDEINKIEPDQNYGWPIIVGEESSEGMQEPLFQTGNDTWAPSGLLVYDDHLYVATLTGQSIRTLDQLGENPQVVTDQYGRVRDVETIDESIYFITNNTDGRGNPDSKDDRLIRYKP
ncbi:PQQ-dependent sugar dehydrogenase [Halobacillus seohaensis]|uniref:PQQ-dependent sugar dehydrogenase n=1 Tax=Halobacillus seohaensis TaxID=447421 RepID=A0ABW2EJP3_9BACI